MKKVISKKGFAAIFLALIILGLIFAIGLSISLLAFGQQIISGEITKSTQAYFAAEAGAEDALLRLIKGWTFSSPYNFSIGNSSATIEISNIIGSARTISSQGSFANRMRKVQIAYEMSTDNVSFFYGVQAGDGGIIMANNSKVHGNIFSNGDISGGKGQIDNNVVVSGHHQINISGGTVGGDTLVYDCVAANITGKLTYVNSNSCTSGMVQQQADEIAPAPLPIPQSQIDEWKIEAATGNGGVPIAIDVIINGTQSLGPVQIGTPASPQDLTVNGTLDMTGTIYVTGNIIFNGTTRLDSSYGSYGGVIFADGTIYVDNGAIVNGSGQAGSYLLALSTNNSLDPANPAIDVRNNAGGSIFYTTSGLIYLKNNMSAREITGYKIQIQNNAEVWYESGLENANFSNGPGGSWKVTSWREVE